MNNTHNGHGLCSLNGNVFNTCGCELLINPQLQYFVEHLLDFTCKKCFRLVLTKLLHFSIGIFPILCVKASTFCLMSDGFYAATGFFKWILYIELYINLVIEEATQRHSRILFLTMLWFVWRCVFLQSPMIVKLLTN